MEKILISRDEHAIQRSVNDLIEFTTELFDLKRAFEVLNIGEYNNDVFHSQISHKGENEINTYLDNERNNLKRAGITNEVTINGILKNHDEVTNTYKESLIKVFDKCSNGNNYIDISLIEFSKGKFIVPKSSINILTEKMSIYANGKEEIEIYQQLEKLLKELDITKEKISNYIGYRLNDNFNIKDYVFNNLIKQRYNENTFFIKDNCISIVKQLKKK